MALSAALNLVRDAHHREHDELALLARGDALDDLLGGADEVRLVEHLARALGVRQDQGVRVRQLQRLDLREADLVVRGAVAAVQDYVLLGHLLGNVSTKVHVGNEEDVLLGQLEHHFDGVRGGHADVRPALDLGRGVHIGNDSKVGDLGAHAVHVLLTHHVCHGAIRGGLRHEDATRGVEELHALGHERDTAQYDDRGIEGLGKASQVERVTHVVRETLGLGGNVVVRKNHGVPLAFEPLDLLGERFPAPSLVFLHDAPLWLAWPLGRQYGTLSCHLTRQFLKAHNGRRKPQETSLSPGCARRAPLPALYKSSDTDTGLIPVRELRRYGCTSAQVA